ncbi:hypothetical protein DFP97_101362 [Paenibacillus prosopidis]|uniref:Glyoxalase/bleomycin resistance protein/dioxygenase superfamily protein n=1 Tax=Paenibacillus prosopidis TaxID=630520 RepID=A0A368WA87_9BACL|nr:hypothetical protein DFP97_101362 [Paenibacillus prosopidis]
MSGIHHITAFTNDPQANVNYVGILGLRYLQALLIVPQLHLQDKSGQPTYNTTENEK